MASPCWVWCVQTIIRDGKKVYFLCKSPEVFYENYDDDDDDKYKICSLLLNINLYG